MGKKGNKDLNYARLTGAALTAEELIQLAAQPTKSAASTASTVSTASAVFTVFTAFSIKATVYQKEGKQLALVKCKLYS